MEHKKVVKEFSKWVDDQIDFKKIIGGIGGNIAELVDGPLFGLAIKYGFEKLPDEYKDEAAGIMQSVIDVNRKYRRPMIAGTCDQGVQ